MNLRAMTTRLRSIFFGANNNLTTKFVRDVYQLLSKAIMCQSEHHTGRGFVDLTIPTIRPFLRHFLGFKRRYDDGLVFCTELASNLPMHFIDEVSHTTFEMQTFSSSSPVFECREFVDVFHEPKDPATRLISKLFCGPVGRISRLKCPHPGVESNYRTLFRSDNAFFFERRRQPPFAVFKNDLRRAANSNDVDIFFVEADSSLRKLLAFLRVRYFQAFALGCVDNFDGVEHPQHSSAFLQRLKFHGVFERRFCHSDRRLPVRLLANVRGKETTSLVFRNISKRRHNLVSFPMPTTRVKHFRDRKIIHPTIQPAPSPEDSRILWIREYLYFSRYHHFFWHIDASRNACKRRP